MFSGKTEELIRRLNRAKIANMKTGIFKPGIDVRYDALHIVSHDDHSMEAVPVNHSHKIILLAGEAAVIGIDEAQFFDEELPQVCMKLACRGVRVIVAGLDTDFLGKPFGPMPHLLAQAEYITKLHAICTRCGNVANYSYRKIPNSDRIMLGEKDVYEPRCRKCYYAGDTI